MNIVQGWRTVDDSIKLYQGNVVGSRAKLCVLRAKIDCCKRWRRNGSADELTSTCDVHLEGKQKAYVGSGEDYTPRQTRQPCSGSGVVVAL